jgi:lipopolysaccharide assembly outer membrane protein LptD (OstA)
LKAIRLFSTSKLKKDLHATLSLSKDEMYVHGEVIKKVNTNTIFVSRGQFTTCNLDEPHFAFRANKMKVVNNKAAVTGPVHPEFEGVPIPIYLPFGYYPLTRGDTPDCCHHSLLTTNSLVWVWKDWAITK